MSGFTIELHPFLDDRLRERFLLKADCFVHSQAPSQEISRQRVSISFRKDRRSPNAKVPFCSIANNHFIFRQAKLQSKLRRYWVKADWSYFRNLIHSESHFTFRRSHAALQ